MTNTTHAIMWLIGAVTNMAYGSIFITCVSTRIQRMYWNDIAVWMMCRASVHARQEEWMQACDMVI